MTVPWWAFAGLGVLLVVSVAAALFFAYRDGERAAREKRNEPEERRPE